MKKLVKWIAVMLFSISVLSACGNNNEQPTTVTTTQTENTTSSEETQTSSLEQTTEENTFSDAQTTYPLTITDSMGYEITFEKEPEKVVSLGPNITEMIFALDSQEKLIGRTEYCDYPKEVSSIESVGTLTQPDVEKIISLNPDVVIASIHFSEEAKRQLEDIGIKVVILFEEHKMDGVYSMIETLGAIVNQNDKAAETIADMKEKIAAVQERVKGKEAPSVYYVVGFGEYGDFTAGGDTFIHELITLAGGNNIAKEVSGWNFSLEKLVELDPEIIIVGTGIKDSFMTSENYKDLSAVKNGKVYEMDNNLLDRQGVRNAQGVEILADIFHPAE